MNISPIYNIQTKYSFKSQDKTDVKKSELKTINIDRSIKAKALLQDGKLNITTSRNSAWIDTSMFYVINSDGTGSYKSNWDDGKSIDTKIFSDIYNNALLISKQNNGAIPDEEAVKLAEEVVNTIKINL